jgi:hypothetical protein
VTHAVIQSEHEEHELRHRDGMSLSPGHDDGIRPSNSTAIPQSDVNMRRASCPAPGTSTTR